MTLDEKIVVLEAARRGERIQIRSKCNANDVRVNGWTTYENWTTKLGEWRSDSFNFYIYDYRIKPKNTISITTRKGTSYEVTANNDGSMSFGCETVESKDADAIFNLRNTAH